MKIMAPAMAILFQISFLISSLAANVGNGTDGYPEEYEFEAETNHSTRSYGTLGSFQGCDCENRAFDVIYGAGISGYKPRNNTEYGDNVWCFDYAVARTKDGVDTCSAAALDHVLFTVDNEYQGCQDMCTCTYRSMVRGAGCECAGDDGCCDTVIGSDPYTQYTGVQFSFDRLGSCFQDGEESVTVWMCVEGVSETMSGLVGFYAPSTYSYTCDNYEVPAYCAGVSFSVHYFHYKFVHSIRSTS